MHLANLLMQEEEYALFDGRLYMADMFGDLYVRNQFGSWTPLSEHAHGKN